MTAAVCAQTVPAGFRLGGWQVESVAGVYGDAIVYNARHSETEETVFVQEYFPAGLAARQADGSVAALPGAAGEAFATGREIFLMQAAALAGLCAASPGPHLPRVRSVFALNGTAFMVMDRHGGTPLATDLALRPGQPEDGLPQDRLIALFRPLALALGKLHEAGICHWRIRPAVILRQNRRLLLTGFAGGVRLAGWEDGHPETAYFPVELLLPVAKPGPWSDIYALAAVLYHCMTGSPPPQADTRLGPVEWPQASIERYSVRFREAVARALACVPAERPRTMDDWCAAWPGVDLEADPAPVGSEAARLPVRSGDGPRGRALAAMPETDEPQAESPGRRARVWPYLGGAALAGVLALALLVPGRPQPQPETAEPRTFAALPPPPDTGPSAPLMLLDHEAAAARDAAQLLAAQAAEAQRRKWPPARVTALKRAAARAGAAARELEALPAAPDAASHATLTTPGNRSFAAVLAGQREIVRTAIQEAWQISVDGYRAAAAPLAENAGANLRLQEKLLADDPRPEPARLLAATSSAHALLAAAHQRLLRAAELEPPADAVIAARHVAEMSAALDEMEAQSAVIRSALQKGRDHARTRQAEETAAARERRQFSTAVASARRAVAELEQAVRAAETGRLSRQTEREAALLVSEARRRLSRLEQIVLDSPDVRGERLQAALVDVRETEGDVRSLLLEVRGQAAAGTVSAAGPGVERLLRRADTRLARNNRRYSDLQKLLARHGGVIQGKDGAPVGRQDLGAVYQSLMAQMATRERLARARTAAEAESLYKTFLELHARVDRDLDRMLKTALKAERQ